MATFYGGEQLSQTIHKSYDASLTDFTIYTVPSGFYAEFVLLYANLQASSGSLSIDTVSGDKEFYPATNGEYKQQGNNILSGTLAPGNALKYKDSFAFAQPVALELMIKLFKMS